MSLLGNVGSETLSAEGPSIRRYDTLVLASDHAGYPLKNVIADILAPHCAELLRLGAESEEPVDFPDITLAAVDLVRTGRATRAILACGTGAGACIAANKVVGIRAAVATDTYVARQCVVHDDVNTLCLGAWIIGPQIVGDVVRAFLAAEFSTEEHFRRRVAKLELLERRQTQDHKN